MTLAEELKARGLIEHSSTAPEQIFKGQRTVYWGVDPTADSMHIGNLAILLLMKRLGNAGHNLIFLVGGGTGMIGDPKEHGERPLLDEKMVKKNTKALTVQFKKILGRSAFKMVDNASWLHGVKLVSFLRDVGKYFTVNDLVKREVIKRRLEAPDESISYTEFTYALLQGYDYLTLYQKFGCDLQLGASDQWTNILSGVDLIHKKLGKDAYAITAPLITDATGKKFGKSEGNAVWLDAAKTSPFSFYQFWINLPDEGIEKYLYVYTFLPIEEIDALMRKHRENPGEREAQETLARLVTEMVHGAAATAQAAAATDALFGGTPFDDLPKEALEVALAEAPMVTLTKQNTETGFTLIDALVEGSLASSKSDARRLIEGKAISLNGQPVSNPEQKIFATDLKNGYGLVRRGKQGVLVLVLK